MFPRCLPQRLGDRGELFVQTGFDPARLGLQHAACRRECLVSDDLEHGNLRMLRAQAFQVGFDSGDRIGRDTDLHGLLSMHLRKRRIDQRRQQLGDVEPRRDARDDGQRQFDDAFALVREQSAIGLIHAIEFVG